MDFALKQLPAKAEATGVPPGSRVAKLQEYLKNKEYDKAFNDRLLGFALIRITADNSANRSDRQPEVLAEDKICVTLQFDVLSQSDVDNVHKIFDTLASHGVVVGLMPEIVKKTKAMYGKRGGLPKEAINKTGMFRTIKAHNGKMGVDWSSLYNMWCLDTKGSNASNSQYKNFLKKIPENWRGNLSSLVKEANKYRTEIKKVHFDNYVAAVTSDSYLARFNLSVEQLAG